MARESTLQCSNADNLYAFCRSRAFPDDQLVIMVILNRRSTRHGVSWQIVPTVLSELLNDPDPEKARRAMKAMLQMKRIDVETLKRAVG